MGCGGGDMNPVVPNSAPPLVWLNIPHLMVRTWSESSSLDLHDST